MKKKINSLLSILIILSVVLAACGSKESSSSGEKTKDGKVNIEILSWWTAGGEADALNAVLDGFSKKYPDIHVQNAAVAGGGGANSQAVLSTRLQGGDPPAVFQAQGGTDLLRWEEAGFLDNLDKIYEDNDWKSVFPEKIVEMNTKDGHIYGLPMNVHRNNVLWYNKKVFEENGLTPPKTWDEFFKVADALKAKEITPFALGDKNPRWATLVFEMVLLEKFGPEKFAQLLSGDLSFDSDGVKESVKTFQKILSYTNDNHSSLDWQDAADLLINNKAAMHIMGDWESGYFESKSLEPDKDYGWVAAPGTDGVFNVVNDSMALPKNIKNPKEAKKFVEYLGSAEAQGNFNKLKGSIPARTDVDLSSFGVYSQSAAEDFKTGTISISLAGGSATPAGFLTKFDDAVNIFVTQKDAGKFINSLKDAEKLLGK